VVVHKLAKGLDNVEVDEIFACGNSTVYKYTLLICHALADKDKLLKTYIIIPSGARLANIISGFHNITGLPNMCGAIDETHCKLNKKNHHNHLSQVIIGVDMIFIVFYCKMYVIGRRFFGMYV
jgi:hypothetical protein